MNDQNVDFYGTANLGVVDSKMFEITGKSDTDDLRATILALAQFYNDVSVVIWLGAVVESELGKTEKNIPNTRLGALAGYSTFVERQMVGLFVELYELVSKKKDVFNSPYFKKLTVRLTKKEKSAWDEIKSLADDKHDKNKEQNAQLRKLVMIRSTATYHYNNTKPFLIGFRDYMDECRPELAHAFVSYGQKYTDSRFFFSDAAIQKWLQSVYSDIGWTREDILEYLSRTIGNCVWQIVKNYIDDAGGIKLHLVTQKKDSKEKAMKR